MTNRLVASLVSGSAIPVKRHGISGLVSSGNGAGLTLDNNEWVCDYSYYHTGSSNNLIIEFSSAESTPSYSGSYYGIGFMIQDNGSVYYAIITDNNIGSRSEGFYPSSAGRLNIYKDTVLYGRLTRLSSTSIKSESFTDSARTTTIGGTPVSATLTISADIQDLTQISIWANGNGSNSYFADLKI